MAGELTWMTFLSAIVFFFFSSDIKYILCRMNAYAVWTNLYFVLSNAHIRKQIVLCDRSNRIRCYVFNLFLGSLNSKNSVFLEWYLKVDHSTWFSSISIKFFYQRYFDEISYIAEFYRKNTSSKVINRYHICRHLSWKCLYSICTYTNKSFYYSVLLFHIYVV